MSDLPDALLLARIQFAFSVSFHFLFPVCHSRSRDHLGSRNRPQRPGLHALGHGLRAAHDPGLYRLVLLGVPRQGRDRGLPLTGMESPLWKRLAWMAAIWCASVAALGLVTLVIKFWLSG